MSLTTMYPAKNNSPTTVLTASLSSTGTTMTVDNSAVFPAAPNLAVIGTSDTAEIVLYTAINGNELTIVRGQNGTTPGSWSAGTSCARNFTAADHEAFRENILDLESRKLDSVSWGDISGTLSDQTDLNTALSGKQATLTFDNNPTTGSSNPVKSSGIYDAFAKEIMYFTNQATSVTSAASAEYCRITDSRITADTVVLNCEFTVPSAITSDVSWESASGYISLKGICTSTNCKVNIVLGQKGN